VEKNTFFSKNLKTWLFAHEMTQNQLGEALNITGTAVGKWINENRPPKGPAFIAVCNHIGLNPEDILNKDLTYQIIQSSNYTDLSMAAEPYDQKYQENSMIKVLVKHIEDTQEQLKIIEKAGEKVLAAAKMI